MIYTDSLPPDSTLPHPLLSRRGPTSSRPSTSKRDRLPASAGGARLWKASRCECRRCSEVDWSLANPELSSGTSPRKCRIELLACCSILRRASRDSGVTTVRVLVMAGGRPPLAPAECSAFRIFPPTCGEGESRASSLRAPDSRASPLASAAWSPAPWPILPAPSPAPAALLRRQVTQGYCIWQELVVGL